MICYEVLGFCHYFQKRYLRQSVGVMRFLLLISILMLGACAERGKPLPTAWIRTDGRPANSGLLDIDSLDCKDELAASGKVDDGGSYSQAMVDNFVSCMREHGYVQIKS